MRRPASTLVVALLVVGAMIAVPAVSASHTVGAQELTPTDGAADGDESIAPGERFSGVVGVQKAEIDGDVESRAFAIQVANAESDDAKASVVAQRHQQNEQRLAELQERLSDLEQARENGSISYGEYAARTAAVHSELRNVERSTNETAEVAEGIPDETLAANGVDREAIDTLRKNASEMSGQEVADLARPIAGPSVDRGPPERTAAPDRGNQTAESDRGADDRGPGGNGANDAGSTDNETAGTADDNATETDSGSDSTGGGQAPTEDESTGDDGAGRY
jgi:hypothetical protein